MDYKKASDSELLLSCRKDDNRAFAVLFQRYFKGVYQYALRYGKDEHVAEELAMDVMYRFWEKRNDINNGETVSSYLLVAVRRRVIDHWRKKELEAVDISALPVESLPETAPADAHLEHLELEKIYQASLTTLHPKEKEVFLLSREEGLSYPQIAERMGISVNTVKSHMKTSLRTFRNHISPYSDLVVVLMTLLFQ